MRKISLTKKIVIALIVIVVIFIGCIVYMVMEEGHSFNWQTCKQYTWIFKEATMPSLVYPHGNFVCGSEVKKNDVFTFFDYYHDNRVYPVLIWEFKNLKNINLNKIPIQQNVDLSRAKIHLGETFASNSSMPISVKFGFNFHGGLKIKLDNFSKIDGTFKGKNYRGFYGSIDKMTFDNGKGETQIVFDYTPKPYKASFAPSVFLLYKARNSFFVIIINSEKPFKNADIINILNLK